MVICAGLDLSVKENKPSGFSIVKSNKRSHVELIVLDKVYSDAEIIDYIEKYNVDIIAIDSPLSIPLNKSYRDVDLKMIKMGFRVLPPTWTYMKQLTMRAIRIVEELKKHSPYIEVIETHPSSCLKSSKCGSFIEFTEKLGITLPSYLDKDEKDAFIASIVGVYYSYGECLIVKASDGFIALLPKIC